MIDIHCHLLPGVDDGSDSEEKSIEILKEYKKNGIDNVVFTPHKDHPTIKTNIEKIKQSYIKFKPKVERLGIKTSLGSEQYLQPKIKNVRPLFNNFVLIEMPTETFPHFFMNKIFDLQLDGYQIIIAHVERYKWLIEKKEIIENLKKLDIYFQTNIHALENKKAEFYRKNKLIDFISTDHHANSRTEIDLSAYKKYPKITQNMEKILTPYINREEKIYQI